VSALRLVAFALFGLATGSFLNVVIHRVPLGRSVVKPGSRCPSCKEPIRSLDNVPVLSWIILRGRCRNCGTAISVRYPLVELATAALWLGSALRFPRAEEAVFAALATSTLLALAVIDLDTRRLPNNIVLPAIAGGGLWVFALSAVRSDAPLAARAGMSGLAAFGLLFVIALVSGGMGMGDVKLAAFIGLVTGRFAWQMTVSAILISFIGGGLVAVVLLALGRKQRKETMPFGPALAAGATAALFIGASPVHRLLGI
jgi:leader peptidase (prepilin peptidase)/N-methyltransferase